MSSEIIGVPDLGGAEEVEVIEVSVAVGDTVEVDQTLVVLESDKAMMEIPAPKAGMILKLFVKEEDKIEKEGDPLVEMEVSEADASVQDQSQTAIESETNDEPGAKDDSGLEVPAIAAVSDQAEVESPSADTKAAAIPETPTAPAVNLVTQKSRDNLSVQSPQSDDASVPGDVYAGPAVRQLARELGVALTDINGSGPRGRLLKEDVQGYVKSLVKGRVSSGGSVSSAGGMGIPPVPDIDFSEFGEIETVKMSKIARLTATNMRRSWLNAPHVTQFDDADITELEAFRKSLKAEGEVRGTKLTPVPIILKACAVALANNPVLNCSLHSDGEHYIQKHYMHIGMAVDTPRGLIVPVVRDVDKKGLWQLAEEIAVLAAKARDGKLTANEMQGGCFTVSSLGAIGGKGFTPIINTPQVAILGVSKAQIQPAWNGSEFLPRNMLPLSLSYDHRAVNGGDAGRFMTELVVLLGDIRRLSL
ncbi:MAG: 2-oxo acid dehydrogenase subunit E2 [Porticoccaceae bacterium]|nr:2-oxo acid dehydrogenase subunit E2 [Porticoccaceae bacterium]